MSLNLRMQRPQPANSNTPSNRRAPDHSLRSIDAVVLQASQLFFRPRRFFQPLVLVLEQVI